MSAEGANGLRDPSEALALAVRLETEYQQQIQTNMDNARALELKGSTLRRVATACSNCKKDHASCDSGRPCRRCIARGCKDSCTNSEARKRGPKKLGPDEMAAKRRSTGTPFAYSNLPQNPINQGVVQPMLSGGVIPPLNSMGAMPVLMQPFSPSMFAQQQENTNLAENLIEALPDDNDNVMNWLWMLDGFEQTSENDGSSTQPEYKLDTADEQSEVPTLYVRSEEEMQKIRDKLTQRGAEGVWSIAEMQEVQRKVLRLREFVTTEQRRAMRLDFDNGLECYKLIASTISVPTALWDRTSCVHYINQSFIDITGFPYSTPTDRGDMITLEMSSPATTAAVGVIMKKDLNVQNRDDVSYSFDAEMRMWNTKATQEFVTTTNEAGDTFVVGQMYITLRRDVFGLPMLFMSHFFPYPLNAARTSQLSGLELLLSEGKITQEVFVQMTEQQEEEKKKERAIEVLKQRMLDTNFTRKQRDAYQKKLDQLELK